MAEPNEDPNMETRPLTEQEQTLKTSDIAEKGESEKGYLVLVVDDLADSLMMISLFLQEEGYRVVTATNGEDAVRVTTLTRPDLILMDIAMPVLDGLGAARRIRQDSSLSAIPIIAISAFSTDGFLRAAYDVGFEGYLTKPIDLNKLLDFVARLLPAKNS